jgi:hypothetical protein
MESKEMAEAGKPFPFEQFLAQFAEETDRRIKEFDRLQAEWQKEAAERQREAAERQREADRRHEELERVMAEMSAKTEKKLDRLSENLGGLNNSLGSIIETLVAARLWEKFKLYGLNRGFQRVPIFDKNGRGVTDIDILLSDTDFAIAVEVKTRLSKKEYVDRHIERMDLVRRYPPAEIAINGKRVMGAMAGGVVTPAVREYAHECGFFVLELVGESVCLADAPDGFEPKVW